jgi:hypothetical protein
MRVMNSTITLTLHFSASAVLLDLDTTVRARLGDDLDLGNGLGVLARVLLVDARLVSCTCFPLVEGHIARHTHTRTARTARTYSSSLLVHLSSATARCHAPAPTRNMARNVLVLHGFEALKHVQCRRGPDVGAQHRLLALRASNAEDVRNVLGVRARYEGGLADAHVDVLLEAEITCVDAVCALCGWGVRGEEAAGLLDQAGGAGVALLGCFVDAEWAACLAFAVRASVLRCFSGAVVVGLEARFAGAPVVRW